MLQLAEVLEGVDVFNAATTEEMVKAWMTDKGYGMGAVMNALS